MDEEQIYNRLEAALTMVLDEGCWFMSGAVTSCYWDESMEQYVLEAWPSLVKEEEKPEGNGQEGHELYELAEFDFTELVKTVVLEDFHFSQAHSRFDISWKEGDVEVALRLNIKPAPDQEPNAELGEGPTITPLPDA